MKINVLLLLSALLGPSYVAGRVKIVGGSPSDKRYEYFASLAYGNQLYCGGALISPNWAITAAHCVEGESQIDLYFNLINRNNLNDPQAEKRTSSRIISHENYNGGTLENDIALIRFNVPVTDIDPVVLNRDGNVPSSGQELAIFGFGALSSGGGSPTQLHKADVNAVSDNQCISMYGPGQIFRDEMLCAAAPGKDTCQGDSGGPMVIDRPDGTAQDIQVGIVSWGFGCADPQYPGVYAEVSNYISWIENKIGTSLPGPGPSPPGPSPPGPSPPGPSPPGPSPPGPSPPGNCYNTGWSDAVGDGCAWYESRPEQDRCGVFGDDPGFANFGLVASEACCACGGGSTGPGAGVDYCIDELANWRDNQDRDCTWYSRGYIDRCARFGDSRPGTNGMTANEACCVCGGGTDGGGGGGGGEPGNDRCFDTGWHDSDGIDYGCEFYAFDNNCQLHGSQYENFGLVANEACCACGGGSTGANRDSYCYDEPSGWVDSGGDSCLWYTTEHHCSLADQFANNGLTAWDVCCVCNGGSRSRASKGWW